LSETAEQSNLRFAVSVTFRIFGATKPDKAAATPIYVHATIAIGAPGALIRQQVLFARHKLPIADQAQVPLLAVLDPTVCVNRVCTATWALNGCFIHALPILSFRPCRGF
jgi:hypothetical protein